MCTVSMIGDHYSDKYKGWQLGQSFPPLTPYRPNGPSQDEFDALKRDVEEMKALLLRAKKYDEEHGEPACEQEAKVALLRQIAEMVGVDLSEVFRDQT